MNIVCVICSDLLVPSDDVFHTPCGHIFHFACLSQWLERSRSCPQCREKTTTNKIHRIYFNFSNNETITEDACSLQDRIDKLKFQLMLRDKDIKHYTEKNEVLETQSAGLRKEVRKVEGELSERNSAIHALKDQIKYFKQQCSEVDSLRQEIDRLRKKVEEYRNIQTLLNAPPEDVDEMVSATSDPTALITYISVMKREMTMSLAKRRELRAKVKGLQQELTKVSMERNFLSEEHTKRKKLEEELIICESEKMALQNKVQELERNEVTTKKVVNDGSPRVQKSNTNTKDMFEKGNAGNIMNDINFEENVQAGNCSSKKDGEGLPGKEKKSSTGVPTAGKGGESSPYLPVKSQAVFASKEFLLQKRPTAKLGLSILAKKPRLERMEKSSVQSNALTYDGFGGHSKYDQFPTPLTGIQRRGKDDGRRSKKLKLDTGDNQKLAEFIVDSTP